MTLLELAVALGSVAVAIVAVFTLLERITGYGSRWVARSVETGTTTLRQDVNDVKVTTAGTAAALEAHRQYTHYHLGPNGDSPRLHDRVKRIEESLTDGRHEQEHPRREGDDR